LVDNRRRKLLSQFRQLVEVAILEIGQHRPRSHRRIGRDGLPPIYNGWRYEDGWLDEWQGRTCFGRRPALRDAGDAATLV
jgi:hypothetical protein